MAELQPLPFPELVRRMRGEVETSESIFDLPVRKWYAPDPRFDFSAVHFSRRASTPVGPAAGPHTQLAQNIVLAWLAGSRIIELKTVQVNDRLEIPRPCIHVPNVGYNVEWSQELRVGESLEEYAKAAYLVEILKATHGFGAYPGRGGVDTVFDISVGYDLEGIRSEKVTGFIRSLQEPATVFDGLRAQLTGDLAEFRDIELPDAISDCVTLSTFHGCPADEIESIARYLLEELGLNVIIKMNPTLLGFDPVRQLLHERLGYGHLTLRQEAFEMDLAYDAGLEILRRLRSTAERLGREVGAKFTNTLVVQNDTEIFPTQADPYMYVSGPPLHVLAMNLMRRFREDAGFDFPVSFSAGIDAKNFPAAVACGMVPVTTCTDLLRQGGFGRLPAYLRALGRQMEACGVTSREAYVLAEHGHGARAAEEALAASGGGDTWQREAPRLTALAGKAPDELPGALRRTAAEAGLDADAVVLLATRIAGRLNSVEIVPGLADEKRYHASANTKRPRDIDSVLGLYDCINCDLCIPACPNDAIFAYETVPVTAVTERLAPGPGGVERSPGAGFEIATDHQLAVFVGACNECSNCEEYCPEEGAPFRVKEQVFGAMDSFTSSDADGFFRDGDTLHARLGGRELRLDVEPSANRGRLTAPGLSLELRWEPLEVLASGSHPGDDGGAGEPALDTAGVWRMKTAWESIYHSSKPSPVNPGPGS
jgi:putative selenate reductase